MGGLTSGPAVWYMGLMAFSTAFLSYRLSIAMVALIGTQVVAIYFATKFNLLAHLNIPKGVSSEELHILNFCANLIVIGFVFRLTSILRVRQRQLIYDNETKLLLSSKSESLNSLASGISHEINNPLMAIKGQLHFLKKKHPQLYEEPDVRKRLTKIEEVSTKIFDIVRTIKDLGNNRMENQLQPLEVTQLLVASTNLVATMARDKGVDIKVYNLPHHVFILGQQTLVNQVLLNLLNNSIQAIEHLDEKWIYMNSNFTSDELEIMVTDSGSGISKEEAERIFDPFFTTKEVGKGTGLGLSLCRTAMERMEGSIRVNHESENTQFILTFKITTPEDSSAAA